MNKEDKITLSLQDRAKEVANKLLEVLAQHRLIVVIIIIGVTLFGALLRTRSYIDVSRNEERYNEEVLQINYKQIDSKILEELKRSYQNNTFEVNSNFETNRRDPFTE